MITNIVDGRKVRPFVLSDSFIDTYAGRQPNWGPVGYLTYKRTYARKMEDGKTEEFYQTLKRVVEGTYTVQKIHCRNLSVPWDDRKAQASAQEMYRRMWDFKFLPPGRGLEFMGTDTVYLKGGAVLNNCGFVSTKAISSDLADPFCWLMDMAMFGVGVGSNNVGAYAKFNSTNLPKVKLYPPKVEGTYVVEDSREGWVNLTRTVINAFAGKNNLPANIDYSRIRPEGSEIKGMGGIASGPGPLIKMIDQLINVLTVETPTFITSKHITSVANIIGSCVVSGGLRRVAEIMIGDANDELFLSLKDPKELNQLIETFQSWYSVPVENRTQSEKDQIALIESKIESHPLRQYLWASNNSVVGTVGMDYSKIVDQLVRNGEPGIFWLDNAREFGRMMDGSNWIDEDVEGPNPCAEQSLHNKELCTLVETFPSLHESEEDYMITLKYAYLYAKTVTLIPTHDKVTNAVMMKNRRIGLSQSGIQQAINKFGRRRFLMNFCDAGYKTIDRWDRIYSAWLGIPRSIKKTSIKPSGTVSLLPGVYPGIHDGESEYYIRRIQLVASHPLVEIFKTAGYHIEASVYADNTVVVSIPVHDKSFKKGKEDVTVWEQFQRAADLQHYWADNMVSVTITFKENEIKDIQTCLEAYETKLKAVSLLPLSTHGYAQAPYEKISKERYEEMTRNLKEIDYSSINRDQQEKFCDGTTCSISFNKG